MKEGEKCQVCGKPATRFLFAAFVCDDEECIQKARAERGGPGGHQKQRMFAWRKPEDEGQ
ncbi:MAG: hypothetical protein MUE55_03920 [Thermoplasmata archaeon]|jgi:hypothetical protein|nr:hypothetical protein [Thermoplasmata archaeon]